MTVLFPLISFPYASRALGVRGLGQYQYCVSVISYFVLLASLGVGGYAIREGAKYGRDSREYSKFVKEIFAINLGTTVFSYLALGVFFLLGAYQGKRELMAVCSLSIIGTTLCIDWLYQSLEKYVYISLQTMLLQGLSLLMMFAFVKGEGDILLYAAISVFASKGCCFLNLYNARRYIDFKSRQKLELRKHLKPILVIFGATLSVSVYMNMDVVMLGFFCGDYQVGLYSAAVKVNVVVKNIIVSISAVLLPRLAAYLASGQKEKYEELFRQGAGLNLFFSVGGAVGLFVLSEPIVVLFGGREFAASVWTGRILALRLIFSALDNIFYNQALIPTGHEREACIGTAAGAASNLCLNLLLIPSFKAEGAALATVLSEGVVFVYFIWKTRGILSLRFVLGQAHKFLIAGGVMGLALSVGRRMVEGYVKELFLLTPAGAALYLLVLWALLKSPVNSKGGLVKKRR